MNASAARERASEQHYLLASKIGRVIVRRTPCIIIPNICTIYVGYGRCSFGRVPPDREGTGWSEQVQHNVCQPLSVLC